MNLEQLRGRRVVLLGIGADVASALPAIRSVDPASISLVDDADRETPLGLGRLDLEAAVGDGEVFVRSPGFPRYLEALERARSRGALMTTPMDLWLGTHGHDRTVVMVSGTKGKSTVTGLIGLLAGRSGLEVGVAGNMGVPLFSPDWPSTAHTIVLEVSSYQAADLHHVADVGVLTSLAEDHLSWHGNVDRYVADKLRAFENEGRRARIVLVPASDARAQEALEGAGLRFEAVETPTGPAEVPPHRLQNAALAAAVLHEVGGLPMVDPEIVAAARTSMPGRLDACPGPPDLLCLDDTLASNPTATTAALRWLRGLGRAVVVLVGGVDRGVSMEPLADEVREWPATCLRAVALPDSGVELAAAAGLEVAAVATDVADATRRAVELSSTDGVVLFSPAAPTPPVVGNWETRSRQFREALAALS